MAVVIAAAHDEVLAAAPLEVDDLVIRQHIRAAVAPVEFNHPAPCLVTAELSRRRVERVECCVASVCQTIRTPDILPLREDEAVHRLALQPDARLEEIFRRLQRVRLEAEEARYVVILDGNVATRFDDAADINLANLRRDAVDAVVDDVRQVDIAAPRSEDGPIILEDSLHEAPVAPSPVDVQQSLDVILKNHVSLLTSFSAHPGTATDSG